MEVGAGREEAEILGSNQHLLHRNKTCIREEEERKIDSSAPSSPPPLPSLPHLRLNGEG